MMHWHVLEGLLKNPKRGAEVGVRAGNCTEYLLLRFKELTLYAVDLWEVLPPKDRPGFQTYKEWDFKAIKNTFKLRMATFGDRCIPLQMDSVAAADEVEDASLDFVFIDAEHTYEGVKRDIAAWRPKVKPGGLLSGHDYGHHRFPGVAKAVDEYFPVQVKETVWWTRL